MQMKYQQIQTHVFKIQILVNTRNLVKYELMIELFPEHDLFPLGKVDRFEAGILMALG